MRRGDWIQTFTGRKFYPIDPRPEDVDIVDIAHALALKTRYGGHCSQFYSVAQHSVLVAQYVPEKYALWGLLHDAAEAYLADIPRPVKPDLPGWRNLENRVTLAIVEHFGLSPMVEPPEVKEVDSRILRDEAAVLMQPLQWEDPEKFGEPLGVRITPWRPQVAKARFLTAYRRYV